MVVSLDSRFCEACLSVKPLAEFRLRSRSDSVRLNQCRECHNRAERERRARKRTTRDRRRMAGFLTKLKNESSDERLELLCRQMIESFGGTQGFVAAWICYHERAMKEGGIAAMRCFQSVIRLVQYCEANRPQPIAMTDEELEQAMLEQVTSVIREQPELAVAAANEIGRSHRVQPRQHCRRDRQRCRHRQRVDRNDQNL